MQPFECLQHIPDPRKKRGIRHPFQPVLKLVLLGFTCRLVAIEHMVSFFKPIWNQVKGSLGFNRPEPPDPTTIRRMLNGLKPEQLQEAFQQYTHSKRLKERAVHVEGIAKLEQKKKDFWNVKSVLIFRPLKIFLFCSSFAIPSINSKFYATLQMS
ncbi:MAG TPA: transposase family protein [Rhabdochlamydiaceae bacterium]|jgi:hypothetical protein